MTNAFPTLFTILAPSVAEAVGMHGGLTMGERSTTTRVGFVRLLKVGSSGWVFMILAFANPANQVSKRGQRGSVPKSPGERQMHAAIDWVMQTYGNLSLEEERAAREKVSSYRAEKPDATEQRLALEGRPRP
ncbi:hypothetical protein [Bradyrhizobium sp. sBnM-33]|uniref:hypothetical protein n=1 Tax=Bradyrhizobium sp. sBnM-33 TaxID=2831780 RepID=UPI001BCA8066|nr:hypothetical protein [Bradyrhizobium sp. sBnM-33]WOH51124.1 hypothetical protein RX328_02095 [Bradyrhizobium sp. sBnM-33]